MPRSQPRESQAADSRREDESLSFVAMSEHSERCTAYGGRERACVAVCVWSVMVDYHHPVGFSGEQIVTGSRRRLRSRKPRRCVSCNCYLAADNHTRLCAPCHAVPCYDPRIDAEFSRKLADYLGRNVGRLCSPCAHFGITREHEYVVHREVVRLKCSGWVITGVRGQGFKVAAVPGTLCVMV